MKSEILSDYSYWQEIVRHASAKFGADLEDIISSVGDQRISMYHRLVNN